MSADIRADTQKALQIFGERLGGMKPAWADLAAAYNPLDLQPQIGAVRALFRDVLGNRMFACQNREGECKRAEGAIGEFKSVCV